MKENERENAGIWILRMVSGRGTQPEKSGAQLQQLLEEWSLRKAEVQAYNPENVRTVFSYKTFLICSKPTDWAAGTSPFTAVYSITPSVPTAG
jgi:hypothetical protein